VIRPLGACSQPSTGGADGGRSIHRGKRERQTSLIELLARAEHALARGFRAQIRDHGISSTEWRVMEALVECDGASMTELGEQVALKQPTLSKMIDRMAKVGLVERRVADEDRRRTLVHLTARGRRVVAPLLVEARAYDAAVSKSFGEAPSRELKAALLDLIRLVQNQPRNKRKR
jgi:MarR family transcriptional regulator, organic hydroperoxide resistance regulator